jgi:hypothetical protein
MKRPILPLLLLALTLVPASPAAAQRLAKGKSVIWAGLNGNDAQLVGPFASDITYRGSEVGLHLAYSYFLSDAWTAVVSGGFDVGSDVVTPPGGGGKLQQTSNSWNVRLGFDRYAFINDGVAIYAGPGLLFWRGHAEGDGYGDPDFDRAWPEVQQIAFNGRLGMYARFAAHYALFGHIGQVIGHNHADDGSGEHNWWSNHFEGSVGVAIDL